MGEKEQNGNDAAGRITFKAKEGATLARGVGSPAGGSSDDATGDLGGNGMPDDQPTKQTTVGLS